MPEIKIRPATSADIPSLIGLDHTYTSDYAWQMEVAAEEGMLGVSFRQIRLPRSVRVDYPRPVQALAEEWSKRDGLLVAMLNDELVGYIGLKVEAAPATAWISDLVVMRRLRRQGIGSGLVLAAQDWALQHGCKRLVLEMQPKNHPAIQMAHKLGFDFCGYNDRYYANHDIALFFARSLR